MKFKPRAGVKVRDPITKLHVPADGVEVDAASEAISYYVRRVQAGDMVVVPELKPATPAPRKATERKE